MVLIMSRPWKHPKTGTYYLRKHVPTDLRNAVGAEVVKITLETKDPVAAKPQFIKALSELELRWANMRLGEQKPIEREAHILANRAYEVWVRVHRNEPSIQTFWHTNLYENLRTTPLIELLQDNLRKFGAK